MGVNDSIVRDGLAGCSALKAFYDHGADARLTRSDRVITLKGVGLRH
jgi:hypothetical protein